MWQILHITDLHIKNPLGDDEYLRAGFYDEYLDTLIVKVRPLVVGEIDCLVITGDFIDQGNVGNFGHAEVVINYLAEKLKLRPEKIALCNGNHDIVRDDERSGNTIAARAAFKDFSNKFASKNAVKEIDRAVLLKPSEKLWCLMIDTTLGSGGENNPGGLDTAEADAIMGWIKELPTDELLVIGAHYPVHNIMADGAVFDEDNPLWAKQHIWQKGVILKDRIKSRPERPQVIWLSGDIHKSFNVSHNEQYFMATGRLGTMTGVNDSQVRRQARVVKVPEIKASPIVTLLEFVPFGHSSQPHLGRWTEASEEYTNALTNDLPPNSSIAAPVDVAVANAEPSLNTQLEEEDNSVEVSESPSEASLSSSVTTDVIGDVNIAKIELIDSALQDELMNTIRGSHLYHFGRFDTSDVEVSLSWIPISPLLNEGNLLSSIINCMVKWLRERIDFNDDKAYETTLLIGMDCWGSVLASQLSVLIGIPNLCVGERGGGEHYVPAETLSSEASTYVENATNIVLVSDVIATGLSLERIHQKVCEVTPKAEDARWLALSVICDEKQQRTAKIDFLEIHGTACKDLRMPVLPTDSLPDESMLPPLISFK